LLTLALESSAKPASVAVCLDGELLGLYFQNRGLTHSRTLLQMAESLLKDLDMQISEIDVVAVARGPGSFTGVRIGVSAAKGLAWGLDVPVCGVSTLEAMAYQAPVPGGLLCPVMDARRGQVYNALFALNDSGMMRLVEDRAISLEALADELRAYAGGSTGECMGVGGGGPILLTGDGASIAHEYLTAARIDCRVAPGMQRWQSAYGVALASADAATVPAIELEPSYLRPSQAEREKLGK